MALVQCPSCQRRNPSSARSCVHCDYTAPTCTTCNGTGVCKQCEGEPSGGLAPCKTCGGGGSCPQCKGNRVCWPAPS